MFSLEFSYCSKDRWQFCNFLHKLTGGILVNKRTTLFLFLTKLNGHETHLLQTHLLPLVFTESFLWSSPNPSSISGRILPLVSCRILPLVFAESFLCLMPNPSSGLTPNPSSVSRNPSICHPLSRSEILPIFFSDLIVNLFEIWFGCVNCCVMLLYWG